MLLIFALSACIILCDQYTKWIAVTQWQQPLVFTDWFRFIYHENPGIAFSIPVTGFPLIILTCLLIIAGLWICFRYLPWRQLPYQIAIGLVLGGAVGNGIDRFRLHYVIDFISVGWFPVFNIADSAITIGGVVLFILLTWFDKEEPTTTSAPSEISPTTHN